MHRTVAEVPGQSAACAQEALAPASLDIRNDSHKHAGHSGNPTGAADAETHFT